MLLLQTHRDPVPQITHGRARGLIDDATVFSDVMLGPQTGSDVKTCVENTRVVTDKVVAGGEVIRNAIEICVWV